MNNFKPTYLYIKEHTVTGMLYFGKTSRSEKFLLEKYNGSGRHWNNHLKKHGEKFVKTKWYKLFNTEDDCREFAEFFSELFEITESKKWANEKPETGVDGGSNGRKGWNPSDKTREIWSLQRRGRKATYETKQKMSNNNSGVNNFYYKKVGNEHPLTGFKHSKEECQKRSLRVSKIMSDPERRKNIANKLARNWEIIDPHGNTTQVSNLTQWCKDNKLKYSTIRKSQKGWKCTEIK